MMKLMREEQIPDFVADVIGIGCNITAIGDKFYVIGDADLPEPQRTEVQPVLHELTQRYGSRDHLSPQIVQYLHSIGRSYPPTTKH